MRCARAVVSLFVVTTSAPVSVLAQTPDTDIYLAELSVRNGRLVAGAPRNVTRRVGYDNQPHFTLDGRALLYTVIDSTGQADIWRYEVGADRSVQVTRTAPESEYSPTPLRAGGFTVVRVERDSAQRLWRFADDGTNARLVLGAVKPVGYHAWASDDVVVLFVLGSPATLQVANARTGAVRTYASDVGRSIQRVPGRAAASFVWRAPPTDSMPVQLREIDARTGALRLIAAAPQERQADGRTISAEFHAWTPSGVLLTSLGCSVLAWDAAAREWYVVGDFAAQGLVVTRLSVSPAGDRLALVGQSAAR